MTATTIEGQGAPTACDQPVRSNVCVIANVHIEIMPLHLGHARRVRGVAWPTRFTHMWHERQEYHEAHQELDQRAHDQGHALMFLSVGC